MGARIFFRYVEVDVPGFFAMNVVLGIDALRYPLTGIGRYVHEIGCRLPHANGVDQLQYMRGGKVFDRLLERAESNSSTVNQLRFRQWASDKPALVRAYQFLNALKSQYVLQNVKDAVFHGPNYYLPRYNGPCVATFHDLSVFLWPECHPKARVRVMQRVLPKVIKQAQVLITDSEFTRQEIAAYFNVPLHRIVCAPLAASSEFFPMNAEHVRPWLSVWGLSYQSYSLFVGTLDPRKNISLLLDVYERLPDTIRKRVPLVVAGYEGWKSESIIRRLQVGERAGWAKYLRFVEEAALPALYAAARVFVYPSCYEGFGLPVLEAMTAGVPVICTNAASLPEVVGTAGVLIPVGDVDALYEAVLQAIDNDTWCKERSQQGLVLARQFSWEKTVAKTVSAYQLASC